MIPTVWFLTLGVVTWLASAFWLLHVARTAGHHVGETLVDMEESPLASGDSSGVGWTHSLKNRVQFLKANAESLKYEGSGAIPAWCTAEVQSLADAFDYVLLDLSDPSAIVARDLARELNLALTHLLRNEALIVKPATGEQVYEMTAKINTIANRLHIALQSFSVGA